MNGTMSLNAHVLHFSNLASRGPIPSRPSPCRQTDLQHSTRNWSHYEATCSHTLQHHRSKRRSTRAYQRSAAVDNVLQSGDATDDEDISTLGLDGISITSTTATQEEENPYSSQDALSTLYMDRGGEPELEALLAEGQQVVSSERVERIFPFPLDSFQRKAVEHFLQGNSVVVCAPTGAGKTAIAEAAAAATLARGQRVIYTTPLKALSNQKLYETRKRFGMSRAGLQTGDTSLNTEADIVIMTTEILRNIMYRTAEVADDGLSSSSTRDQRLGDVGLIVLDEVHYLGDPGRGSVWEEVIINCPKHIQLLAMSATVKNPDDLGDWISKEHRRCVTIKTRFRPVPLKWHFCYGSSRGAVMKDLLINNGRALSSQLETRNILMEEARSMLARGRRVTDPAENSKWEKAIRSFMDNPDKQVVRRIMTQRVPALEAVLAEVRKQNMLPAIWFILSRKECDISALKVASTLTTEAEKAAIQEELDLLREEQPDAVREKFVPALLRGVAAHHAGCLPGWKTLVEKLFQAGLLKVVFATGTLAAGINMPARTTIISQLSRKTDDGVQLLPHNELLQMAGRAGRRGYDTEGHCIVLQNRFEGAEAAWQIIKKGPEPLISQFAASYGLVLNLLSVYSLDEAREFLAKSFGTFLNLEGTKRKLQEIETLEKKAAVLEDIFQNTATASVKGLTAAVKTEKARLKALKAEALQQRCERAASQLEGCGLPAVVVLNLSRKESGAPVLMPALVVGVVEGPALPSGQDNGQGGVAAAEGPFYLALTADNRVVRAAVVHVVGLAPGAQGLLSAEDLALLRDLLADLDMSSWPNLAAGRWSCQVIPGSATMAKLATQLQVRKELWQAVQVDEQLAQSVVDQAARVKLANEALLARRKAVESNSVADNSSMRTLMQAGRLRKQAAQLQAEIDAVMANSWNSFMDVVDILVHMDALDPDTLKPRPLGLVTRAIQGQNELWLALAFTHPVLLELTGPELASLLGALISADVVRRPTSLWTAYPASPKVVAAIEALEADREALFHAQSSAGLAKLNESLAVDLRLAGIVEAWAAGASWPQVMADCTLDDGDVARLLIRVSDLLRQIAYNDKLALLREAAVEGLRGVDRAPVADTMV